MTPMMFPWLMPVWSIMSPLMRFDVKADNWDYSPVTEWGQGDVQIERRVARDVATPARQLGILTDVVLELARNADLNDSKAVKRLERLIELIEEVKADVRKQGQGLREI